MVICLSALEISIGLAEAGALAGIIGAVLSGFSQEMNDPPVTFAKKAVLAVSNPLDIPRTNEPVIVPVTALTAALPDFNSHFFRIKRKTDRFEPLDIPSQIRTVPGVTGRGEELVFQLDMERNEEIRVDLQYNPVGSDVPDYPPRTQSFGTWYRDGSNSAWENEIIAYRYYFGMVDYFGKSYPGLCLDRLRSDSYHHERLWGQDPYAVGKTPGLGGIALIQGDSLIPCYGYPDDAPANSYRYEAHGGGPVCAGVALRTVDKNSDDVLVEASTTLFHNRYENIVRATTAPTRLKSGVHIAPGMRKFDGEYVAIKEESGFMLAWGRPVEEYGTIGTAFVWHPRRSRGIHETHDARFVRLEPDGRGMVDYRTLAVWYRASSDQPADQEAFLALVRELTVGLRNPVEVIVVP